ncbi:30S ribosomal protein S12 methylthiotransferase accessory factor YcaO [Thorsellia kenyensis]|uniref:30S ribosomal protein S12 methylthiotransferase accessory factor YcaO n=1 Tax=Thorsellia kenyensis TaxID=1549888 RepID=A0ABV6CED0_9GAMM
MQHSFIPGKDAPLEETINRFQTKLSELGFIIEEASWLNPVENVWSVHIKDKECALCFTNGKGASKKAALASALGEYFERLSTNYFFADFYLGDNTLPYSFVHYPNEKWFKVEENSWPEGLLDERLINFYDSEGEIDPAQLTDLQSSDKNRGICALPFIRESDKETVYIPMNIIGNLYVSNGMSAGNNLFEAKVQALSEIFERFVKNKVIADCLALPKIPDVITETYPKIATAIKSLEKEGFHVFRYDASLGGNYPVIAVVLLNPENSGCFASFGAHPNFEVAYERAVTELLQGRSLDSLDVFPSPSFDDEEVADFANLETHFIDSSGVLSWDFFKNVPDYEFNHWDFAGTTEEELQQLTQMIYRLDTDIYTMHYNHLGVDACRIIVPGMSEIYHPDDLIYANNSMGIHLREQILALSSSKIETDKARALLEEFDALDLDESIRIRELLGIATGSDNAWFTLRVGELKSMLYLILKEYDNALMWVEWTVDYNQTVFSKDRLTYYRCLQTLLLLTQEAERHLDEYEEVFSTLYGGDIFSAAKLAIQGIMPFYGLQIEPGIPNTPMSFKAHQNLIAAYHKLQKAKLSATTTI